MKSLAVLLVLFVIQTPTLSQTRKYSFNVEIAGAGKPIVLIPGLASKGSVWIQTVDSLKSKYECHILTLAGFETQNPILLERGYLPIMKNEIINYIKNELSEKPILIGHSLGGFLSLSIASLETDLISQIIIVDSYPFMSLAYNPNATVENVLPRANMMKEMLLAMTDSAFVAQQKVTIPSMVTDSSKIKLATKWSVQSDRATIAQAMFELMTTDLREDVAKVKVPILVLGSWYGAKDYGVTKEMVKTNYENQFSQAINCKIEIAETAKHFIMWDDPIWFMKVVKSFISYEE